MKIKAVITSNGKLVPMRDAHASGMMTEVAGVLPATAKKLLDGEAKAEKFAALNNVEYIPRFSLVDIPEGVETEEIELEDPILPEAPKLAEPRGSIVIPDEWATMKPASLVKLAKHFEDRVDSKEAAIVIIEAEIARRDAEKTA
jgi:hypothetical protein